MLKKAEEVKGYDQLSDARKVVLAQFLTNFYAAWEYPEKCIPVQVRVRRDKSNGVYLRVDLIDGSWYHVKSPTIWY